jgi:peroxiredoxin
MLTVALAALLALALLLPLTARAAPQVGQAAPEFPGTDTAGTAHRLADFKGKTVVLEWTNHDCPFVVKHYESDNMQGLQREAAGEGIVWLSVISSAPGKQGYVTPDQADALTRGRSAEPTAVLLDPEGRIGRAYDARTTPHMYVIDGEGILRYMGGIDDRPSTSQRDIAGAKNYVRAALADLSAGREVAEAVTRPYGCSVKY